MTTFSGLSQEKLTVQLAARRLDEVTLLRAALIVAGGRLTIGLVGSPTNDSVNININGKQQSVATGDVVNIALDPPTTCQVRVQSFDMFRVVLGASCAAAQGQ